MENLNLKKLIFLVVLFALLTNGCGLSNPENNSPSDSSGSDTMQTTSVDEYTADENIRHVNISGNARSIVIKQSANENFEFYNADLNTTHTYEVRCDEKGEVLDIDIMMGNAEADNNILGSFVIDMPQKEFKKVEITGDFRSVFLNTINSDVFIHANDSSVVLDLEANYLDHNITLDGSDSDAFRGVSVYLDKLPDNVRMELNVIQGGTINDPKNILKKNRMESGSGKPVISVNNTKTIEVYTKE